MGEPVSSRNVLKKASRITSIVLMLYPVIELGAGCALPSLLLSTLSEPPSLIVVTDYPDEGILGNLKRNVEKNHSVVTKGCSVQSYGYEWGTDASHLL